MEVGSKVVDGSWKMAVVRWKTVEGIQGVQRDGGRSTKGSTDGRR